MTVASVLKYEFMGGESRTLLVDGSIAGSAPAGWTNVSTPVKTGVGAIRINVNGSQQTTARFVVTADSTHIVCWHAWAVQSDVPSLAHCLSGQPDTANCLALEVGTDSKIRLVRAAAAAPLWTNRVALTGWSTDALATDDATFKEVALYIDPLTLGTSHIWATLFINDVQQWSVDIGSYLGSSAFCTCPPVANAAIYVTLDDVVGLQTTVAAEAPHLKDWPKPEVHRQLPIADTAENDWTGVPDNTNKWNNWKDATGPDDDTSYNRNVTPWANRHQISDGQTEGTVGIDTHTVIVGPGSTGGPCINVIYRVETDGTKWQGFASNSLDVPLILPQPGTTYIGGALVFYKAAAWAITDLTALNFGCEVPNGSEHNMTWRVTMCMMQWLTYVNVYDHTLFTTPSLPGGQRRRGVVVG